MLHLIVATRKTMQEFVETTPLGKSYSRANFDKSMHLHLSAENKDGLPTVYNRLIREELRDHQAVFLHDDVWLDDLFFSWHLQSALRTFDVVGLAGNQRLLPDAPAWHVNDQSEIDNGYLSGIVCHGSGPLGSPTVFGLTPAPVQLLDGVLIAARVSALLDSGVRFDERFNFHFYDLDFSRRANAAGLKVGTWPIAVTHVSGGGFNSPEWNQGLELYRKKWASKAQASATSAERP
jgi:GT2 family glycosyltransferase